MYLKSLELVGFKSFPERTLLEFGPGLTAIVGPNGCGKSNVSDSIRWVLGEQSAKLLRGTKMEDCIFTGTEHRKPLGMAEVTLTLAQCEDALGTDYHEVTVTRRVLRSGEGQYFINKTPCRLKDIHRLFMDTGIGTNSYSLMEQGRIDLVLSSRPEDRRAVFEEASGITKYKTDKREALRKLEQTEANLLRLADIIKEVRRQMISLQRQAGKATRVRKLKEDLRRLDLYVSRERLGAMDGELRMLETRIASLSETDEARQRDIAELEEKSAALHEALAASDRDMHAAQQTEAEGRAQLDRTRQAIEAHGLRLQELRGMIQRETEDANAARTDAARQAQALEQTRTQLAQARAQGTAGETLLREKTEAHARQEEALDAARRAIETLHTESLDLDARLSALQNDRHKFEKEDAQLTLDRARRSSEQTTVTRTLEGHQRRLTEFETALEALRRAGAEVEAEWRRLEAERDAARDALRAAAQRHADWNTQIAAASAKVDVLSQRAHTHASFSEGARRLLDAAQPAPVDRALILGALATQVDTTPAYRTALETALRFWLDAVVVTDTPAALALLRALETGPQEAVRLLVATPPDRTEASPRDALQHPEASHRDALQWTEAPATPDLPGVALRTQVTCTEALRPLVDRLLSGVRVVDAVEHIPSVIPPRIIFVTRQGAAVGGEGFAELYRPEAAGGNPLAQQHVLRDARAALAALEADRAEIARDADARAAALADAETRVRAALAALEQRRQAQARQEGEVQSVRRQVEQAREHLDTIAQELEQLGKQGHAAETLAAMIREMDALHGRKGEIKAVTEARAGDVRQLEQEQKRMQAEVMQAGIQAAQQRQHVEHLEAQHQPLAERIAALEATVRDRAARVRQYETETTERERARADAQRRLPVLETELRASADRVEALRAQRATAQGEWKPVEDKLKTARHALDALRTQKNELTITVTERRMTRQNLVERLTTDYRIAPDAIHTEPEPVWPETGKPDLETVENSVAEIRAKIEAIGPVFEGAAEEYQQLEERYTFLTQQQEDLVQSKQQLMEMIKKINQTTTEMFTQTFTVINANFQQTFAQLFGGGSAKLMLTEDEDILESGIEIIARPPGKQLRSVSLLSGGERTMTAVALLFAIYMVKPSPFCVLDEMDAALDESNIGRFIKMLKGFLHQSQFIVITHNRQTIGAASVLYGVTMEERGVSRIVSMRFTDQPAESPPAAETVSAPQEAPPPSGEAQAAADTPASETLVTPATATTAP